ncbi:hypothetical protein [Aquimarina sediminis]|uniref:hypothetical protein n=1 Tax=Aquimarina sediminis TaxID=2070536 RepID=UPI000CA04BA0|nr:hypothetical protein [Aquimarina sediminis]
MNLGFKESIDIRILNKILEIKRVHSKGYVTISVENKINRDFKTSLRREGIQIKENKLELISSRLIQYKFEWD